MESMIIFVLVASMLALASAQQLPAIDADASGNLKLTVVGQTASVTAQRVTSYGAVVEQADMLTMASTISSMQTAMSSTAADVSAIKQCNEQRMLYNEATESCFAPFPMIADLQTLNQSLVGNINGVASTTEAVATNLSQVIESVASTGAQVSRQAAATTATIPQLTSQLQSVVSVAAAQQSDLQSKINAINSSISATTSRGLVTQSEVDVLTAVVQELASNVTNLTMSQNDGGSGSMASVCQGRTSPGRVVGNGCHAGWRNYNINQARSASCLTDGSLSMCARNGPDRVYSVRLNCVGVVTGRVTLVGGPDRPNSCGGFQEAGTVAVSRDGNSWTPLTSWSCNQGWCNTRGVSHAISHGFGSDQLTVTLPDYPIQYIGITFGSGNAYMNEFVMSPGATISCVDPTAPSLC